MKLWDKGQTTEKSVERFTVGNDYVLDRKLVLYDVLGSLAHVKGLEKAKILTKDESSQLQKALVQIIELDKNGQFIISPEDEDVHTKIENQLTQQLNDLGKKIHTGRSRNDQVLTDIRLYTKDQLLDLEGLLYDFCKALLEISNNSIETPMPGRTHFQKAMPSSVALFFSSFLESMLDNLAPLRAAYVLNDQCPLGSAAGYGVNLPLDRDYTSSLLGFSKVQNNVLYAGSSRGKVELEVLSALSQVMIDLSRLANDLIIFSSPEFSYFTLPDEYCTGSSIMPQKKNPDVLELVRGKCPEVLSYHYRVAGIIKTLPSGYNRDMQDIKEPLMKGIETTMSCLNIMTEIITSIRVNSEKLTEACTKEIYAADEAMDKVKQGIPFRDAYRQVAENLHRLESKEPSEAIINKKLVGGPGNLCLDKSRSRMDKETRYLKSEKERFRKTMESLMSVK